jgi:hypothetical protein
MLLPDSARTELGVAHESFATSARLAGGLPVDDG